jgi:hypothetical protein
MADIRDQLRKDHDVALAELEALINAGGDPRCLERLRTLRRAWVLHALVQETVLYRALAQRFSPEELEALGDSFESAREKLTMLEEAKAA